MTETEQRQAAETVRKFKLIGAVLVIAMLIASAEVFTASFGHGASSRLDRLNGTAHSVYNAIYTWQEKCAELETDAVLPPVSELCQGTDTAADSLTKQISAYYADIEKVPYYRVQSDADGRVTGVLISQRPFEQTWRPDAAEQRICSQVFLQSVRRSAIIRSCRISLTIKFLLFRRLQQCRINSLPPRPETGSSTRTAVRSTSRTAA